jgi:hypothetical protein
MSAKAAAGETDTILVLEGILQEKPTDAPRCGDMAIAVAYRFKVDRVLRGKYRYRSIVVLIPCPDLKGEHFFEAGRKYYLETSINPGMASTTYTIYNDYPGRRLFWGSVVRMIG